MIFLKLYRFFMGKLRVSAEGNIPERILNLCIHNGITIWAIRRQGDRILFYMTARDFFKLRFIIRATGIRIHIMKKRGWPFIVRNYSRRYGAFVGIFMFFAILQLLSAFVWNINVSGNDKISDANILSACRKIGITEGIRASAIDEQKARAQLMQELDGLAWAAINIEGCTITVDVTEAENKPDNDTTPCNLTANANGIIRKMEISHGKGMVKVGDSVSEGQLLVSGVYEYKDGSSVFVRSEGCILAEVSETLTAKVPLKQEINVLSARENTCYTLSFLGLKIPLYLGDYSDGYLRSDEQKKMTFGDNSLPIYLHKSRFRRVYRQEILLSNEHAAEIARARLDEKIKDIEVLSFKEKIVENSNSITVVYDVTSLRDIAKEEILLFSTTN